MSKAPQLAAIVCSPKVLPRNKWVQAARQASAINPVNHPPIERMIRVVASFRPDPMRIAVMTSKYWGAKGIRLTVGFLDNPSMALRNRIVQHMNAWNATANIKFVQATTDPQVRIARVPNDGYWSYVGTDILSIPKSEPTMNLEGFTMDTADSEFHRVVRHETGHTIGCPHEHMRRELVKRIDEKKAIKYFGDTQGWSPTEVRQQVLTALEESSLLRTDHADPNSIMCYQIPGIITVDGKPILGGKDISREDAEFIGKIYPPVLAKSQGSASANGRSHKKMSRKTATAKKKSRKSAKAK